MEAFDMLLFRWVYPPLSTHQKIKDRVSVRYVEVEHVKNWFVKIKSGLNGVGMNSNGLKLWGNDATGLRTIFKQDGWPPRGLNIFQKRKEEKKKSQSIHQFPQAYMFTAFTLRGASLY